MAAVAATFPLSLAAAQQSGQPEWSQFQGGPGHPGTGTDGPAPPYRVRWTRPAPEGEALSGAVIFGGQAMTVGQSAVYAIDLASGDVAWEVPRAGGALSIPAVVAGSGREPDVLLYLEGPETGAGAEVTPSPTVSPSASASPSPSASAPGRGADLVAIDIADQSELWRTPLTAASRTGVTVDGDAAYVADLAGTVYAIGIGDGALRWSRGLEGEGPCEAFDGGRIDSPIAVADGRVVSLARNNDQGSVAVSSYDQATGDCEWRTVSRTGTGAASAPAAGDGNVIVGFGDRVVRMLGGDGGDQRWGSMALSLFLPVSAPAFDADAVYAVDVGGGLYRFDAADGARTWSYQLNETVVRSSPVVVGDAVLVGLNDGRLVAIDAGSGHLVWQNAATPGLIGAMAVAGDTIVAVKGGRDAGLIAFESDPEGSLVDVASPTELELGTTLVRFGLAALLAGAIVLVPGMLARRRFGTAFAADEGVEETAEDGP